jgi:hypothetical protein
LKKASEVAGQQVHKLLAFQSKRNLDMGWTFLVLIVKLPKWILFNELDQIQNGKLLKLTLNEPIRKRLTQN